MPSHYLWQGDSLILHCHLQPKSSHDEFCGLHGDRIKIRITAPPIDGKANSHLLKFLSKSFGVAKSRITIVSGELSRQKTVSISNPTKVPEGALVETK
ncbi:DUF167 family protein [Teredinibacter sp. KSP-S5-2]|uniref:DUF167 family protein n=1 Tax=Teredinibacter sp. KSP-S5-2 TaxID=3034506 RepID=UPI002934FF85|nr:DUF167 family protein [Teredinibacter sp. KSP-S5-2]WNO09346.1 DUF167 family protein [Teredinibacter sp. KSP-S5-2]